MLRTPSSCYTDRWRGSLKLTRDQQTAPIDLRAKEAEGHAGLEVLSREQVGKVLRRCCVSLGTTSAPGGRLARYTSIVGLTVRIGYVCE